MRCQCCNRALSNVEATRKFASGTFTDMCTKCLSTIEDSVDTIDSDTVDVEDGYEDNQ